MAEEKEIKNEIISSSSPIELDEDKKPVLDKLEELMLQEGEKPLSLEFGLNMENLK